MNSVVDDLVSTLNPEIVERVETSPRPERRDDIPEVFVQGPLHNKLSTILGREDNTVWKHQAIALSHLANQRNLVLATGTASGKSLVFQIHALHRIQSEIESRVLVMYPLKALASDQVSRWKTLLRQCGLSEETVGKIDGDVLPEERERILNTSRIIVATPDVVHASRGKRANAAVSGAADYCRSRRSPRLRIGVW